MKQGIADFEELCVRTPLSGQKPDKSWPVRKSLKVQKMITTCNHFLRPMTSKQNRFTFTRMNITPMYKKLWTTIVADLVHGEMDVDQGLEEMQKFVEDKIAEEPLDQENAGAEEGRTQKLTCHSFHWHMTLRQGRDQVCTRREISGAVFFAGPHIVLFTVFIFIPSVYGVYASFTQWDLVTDPVWVGFENYKTILFDRESTFNYQFFNGLKNTLSD